MIFQNMVNEYVHSVAGSIFHFARDAIDSKTGCCNRLSDIDKLRKYIIHEIERCLILILRRSVFLVQKQYLGQIDHESPEVRDARHH